MEDKHDAEEEVSLSTCVLEFDLPRESNVVSSDMDNVGLRERFSTEFGELLTDVTFDSNLFLCFEFPCIQYVCC